MKTLKFLFIALIPLFFSACVPRYASVPEGTVTKYPMPARDKEKYVDFGIRQTRQDGLMSTYLDKTTVAKGDAGQVTAIFIDNYETPLLVKGKSVTSKALQFRFDCQTQQFRIEVVKEYSDPFGKGEIIDETNFLERGVAVWKEVNPKSLAGSNLRSACYLANKNASSSNEFFKPVKSRSGEASESIAEDSVNSKLAESKRSEEVLRKLEASTKYAGRSLDEAQLIDEAKDKRSGVDRCKNATVRLDVKNASIYIAEAEKIAQDLGKSIDEYTHKKITKDDATAEFNRIIYKSNNLKSWGDENRVLGACGSSKVINQIAKSNGAKNYLIDKYRSLLVDD